MPDFTGILAYGPVAREKRGFCNVYQRYGAPLYRIGINAVETVPGLHIGVKVAQDKILVVVLQQGVVNTPKVTSAVFKEAVDELIGNGFKARILPAFLGSAVSAVDIILHGLVCGKAKKW